MPRVHLVESDDIALCGQPWPQLVTAEVDGVTCRRCRRRMVPDPPLEPEWVAAPVTAYSSRTSRLDARAIRAIERSRRGETSRPPRWRHPEHAVRAWVAMRDQAVLRSCGDYSADRIQSNRSPSAGGVLHSRIEATRTVGVALSRAVQDEEGLRVACASLGPQAALGVYLMRVCGRAVVRAVAGRKGGLPERLGCPASEVAARVSEELDVEVTAQDVADLVRHFNGHVRAALIASGEMAGGGERASARPAWDPLRRVREAG